MRRVEGVAASPDAAAARSGREGDVSRLGYVALVAALCVGIALSISCSRGEGGDDEKGKGEELDISVCAPENGPFSLEIDNDWFPLPVGQRWVLEGTDDEGTVIRIEIEVLDETEEIAGVTARVVEASEYEDGKLVEVARDFYVQAPDGTVCYYGEDVDIYEDGEVVSHEGSWRADGETNLPGIMMPADPKVGMIFRQEYAPGVAEDMCEIVAFGETVDTPAGEFTDTMRVEDWNPLEDPGERDTKYYAYGVGLIVDEDARLISTDQ